jgi:hypothetical protein
MPLFAIFDASTPHVLGPGTQCQACNGGLGLGGSNQCMTSPSKHAPWRVQDTHRARTGHVQGRASTGLDHVHARQGIPPRGEGNPIPWEGELPSRWGGPSPPPPPLPGGGRAWGFYYIYIDTPARLLRVRAVIACAVHM